MIGPDSLQQNGTITFDGETEHPRSRSNSSMADWSVCVLQFLYIPRQDFLR